MKKTLAIITAAIMLVFACLPTGASLLNMAEPDAAINELPAEVPASAQEWEVLRITNAERMNAGIDPLTMFSLVQDAADTRAPELIESFSHTRPDGTSCYTALDEAGIVYCAAGENIAAGYGTPAAVMNGWMNSDGHRANILNANYKHVGVGYFYSQASQYGAYWVQLFCTGWSCEYTGFEILGELDMSSPVDSLRLAGRFICDEGYCYMPLTSAMCVGDSVTNGVRTVTFSCFGLTASITAEGGSNLLGDVDLNGTIDSADALLALRCALDIMELDGESFLAADVTGDGVCDSTDALLILRYALGVIDSF